MIDACHLGKVFATHKVRRGAFAAFCYVTSTANWSSSEFGLANNPHAARLSFHQFSMNAGLPQWRSKVVLLLTTPTVKLTREEIRAKSDATRLRNLREKNAAKEALNATEKKALSTLSKKERQRRRAN